MDDKWNRLMEWMCNIQNHLSEIRMWSRPLRRLFILTLPVSMILWIMASVVFSFIFYTLCVFESAFYFATRFRKDFDLLWDEPSYR